MEGIVSGEQTGGAVNSRNMDGFSRVEDLDKIALLGLIMRSSDKYIEIRSELIETRLRLADRTMECADLKMEVLEYKELAKC